MKPFLSFVQLRILSLIFLSLISLLPLTTPKIHFDSQWATITEQALLSDPLIQVQGTSKQFSIDQYQISHLKFSISGKNKRKTYEQFLYKYKKIVSILLKNKVIPHDNSMIHSNIQMNFISKRRVWEFSRIFVIYAGSEELDKIMKILDGIGVRLTRLRERVLMGYLNEKFVAIKAFTAAKAKLERFLKGLGGGLEIVYVVDIQILGKKFLNEQVIQLQIKNQNNYSKSQDQIITTSQKNPQRNSQVSDKQFFDEQISMKVLFKVGKPKQKDKEKEKQKESKQYQIQQEQKQEGHSDESQIQQMEIDDKQIDNQNSLDGEIDQEL